MADRFFSQLGASEPTAVSIPVVEPVDSSEATPQITPAPGVSLPTFRATARPASAMDTPQTFDERQGFWEGLLYGTNAEKEQSTGSIIGSSLTDFVRHGVDAGFELFDDQRIQTRREIDKVRAFDPQLADQIEMDIGEKKTTTQNVIRLGAALGETALTVLPFLSAGKATVAAGGAAKGLEAANATKNVLKTQNVVTRTLTKIPGMSDELAVHVATGFKYGAGFGGLDALAKDADFSEALKDAAIGGALGIAFPFAGKLAGKGGAAIADFSGKIIGNTGRQIGFQFGKFLERNPKTMIPFKAVSSIGGTIKTYFGEAGDNFVSLYNKASQIAQIEISDLAKGMVEQGLLKPPSVARGLYKGVNFIGDNKELMTEANLALRGIGMYSNPSVRAEFLQKNPSIGFIEQRFKQYGGEAQNQGLVKELLKNYVPKYTPAVELKGTISTKISQAGSQAEREALYASNSQDVQWMVENAVFNEKAFKTLDEGYAAYYDWASFVAEGGRIGVNNNKFLEFMVTSGRADSIQEAEGQLIRSMKFRESGSLTKKASSLDFEREVDMPFYDVNPARVLSAYGNEVITRLNNSKVFGVDDKVINTLVDKVKTEKGLRQAEAFSDLIDRAMKGSNSGQVAEDISAWIRGIQVFKIGFSTVLQIPQNLNTLLSTDWKSFAHGIAAGFKEEGVRKALTDGALMNSFVREMHMQTSGGTKVADKFLNMIGLTRLDSFNRVVASNAGEMYAKREFSALLKRAATTGDKREFRSISNPEYYRLKELGINVDDAIARGALNEEDLMMAGYSIAKESQFLGRPLDLPYFASSATGKVIMQFRTFAFQQGTFLKRQIWDDLAGKGDFKRGMKNLTIFATIFPMAGEVIADIRSALTNTKRPPIGFERYIDNILSAGGWGLAFDAVRSAESGRMAEFVLGSGISEGVALGENVVKLGQGNGKPLLKQGINALPFGRAATNRIWPQKKPGQQTFTQEMEELFK